MRKLSHYSEIKQDGFWQEINSQAQGENFKNVFGLTKVKGKHNLIVTYKLSHCFVAIGSFDVGYSKYYRRIEEHRLVSCFTPNRDLAFIAPRLHKVLSLLLGIEIADWSSMEFEESLENLESVLKIKNLLKVKISLLKEWKNND